MHLKIVARANSLIRGAVVVWRYLPGTRKLACKDAVESPPTQTSNPSDSSTHALAWGAPEAQLVFAHREPHSLLLAGGEQGSLEAFEFANQAGGAVRALMDIELDNFVSGTAARILHIDGHPPHTCERACCTISTKTFLVSAGLATSRKNAMRAPRMPSWVFTRT